MFSSLFLRFSPINKFVIREKSMEPSFLENETVIAVRYFFTKPKVGDVVIFYRSTPPKILIKRIVRITGKNIWVEGDNKSNSIDSRSFGSIRKENIIGKVIKKL